VGQVEGKFSSTLYGKKMPWNVFVAWLREYKQNGKPRDVTGIFVIGDFAKVY